MDSYEVRDDGRQPPAAVAAAQRDESVVLVEGGRLIVDGVHDQESGGDDAPCMIRGADRMREQSSADSSPVQSLIHCQARQEDGGQDGDLAAAQTAGQLIGGDGGRGQ